MKKIFAVAVSAVMAGGIFAAEALQPQKVTDFRGYLKSARDIENGIRIITPGSHVQFVTLKKIAVDPGKKYLITCEYRRTPGTQGEGRFYFAPVCYDKDGREIKVTSVNCVNGTDTILAAAAKKGDKVVKIKNGAKWVLRYANIAFNTKADYSDLPNADIVPVAAIKQNGAVWELTLKAPLAKDYPAGTAVREQLDGATYRYVLGHIAPETEWKKASRVFSGERRENIPGSASCWRPGTRQAGIIIFSAGKAMDLEIRNISLTEVK